MTNFEEIFATPTLETIQKWLLNHPQELNHQDEEGNTLLHWACYCDSIEIVVYLLERNVDSTLRNNKGRTALHTACRRSCLEIVDKLINYNQELCGIQDTHQNLPLHWACYSGMRSIVDRLLEANAETINNRNACQDGRTPLHSACRGNHISLIFPLLRKGADRTQLDNEEKSPQQLSPHPDHVGAMYEEFDNMSQLKEECNTLTEELEEKKTNMSHLKKELQKVTRKLGYGLGNGHHVRLENYPITSFTTKSGPLKGFFNDQFLANVKCVVKMAYEDKELELLEKEMTIFKSLARKTRHLPSSLYIVDLLHWDFISPDAIYNLDNSGEIIMKPGHLQKGIVLEAGGRNLKDYLRDYPTTSEIYRIHTLEQITKAVKYLHSLGFIHGDLNPNNVVLFSADNGHSSIWKIVDFDNSFDLSTDVKLSQFRKRFTQDSCPPELLRYSYFETPENDKPVNSSFDIWSLGTLALFLFTNRSIWSFLYPLDNVDDDRLRTFAGLDPDDGNKEIQSKLNGYGSKFRELLSKCLQLKPEERSTAEDILNTKRLFGGGETTTTTNNNFLAQSAENFQSTVNDLIAQSMALDSIALTPELISNLQNLQLVCSDLLEHRQSQEHK